MTAHNLLCVCIVALENVKLYVYLYAMVILCHASDINVARIVFDYEFSSRNFGSSSVLYAFWTLLVALFRLSWIGFKTINYNARIPFCPIK